MIIKHETYLPSFHIDQNQPYQHPVCVLTVLSINEVVGDCAAYRGVCPDLFQLAPHEKEDIVESVRAGGNKIGEVEARKLFAEIEDMGLRYRR